MTNSAQTNEYSALQNEYAAFVKSMAVIADRVHIVTFENVEVESQFNAAGWTVLAISTSNAETEEDGVKVDDVFETSEALLMSLSPRFRQLWNDKLFEKLSSLQ